MEHVINTSLYNQIMDLSGVILTVLLTGWFCYYLFKRITPFRKWGKVRRHKIDGPVGLDS
jgi:hypothetical protein